MPSSFDQQFSEQAFPTLVENYGEPVTYYRRSGGRRAFDAIITRDPPAIYDAFGNVVSASYRVRFHGACKGGIKASEIDTGGDEISFIAEPGDVTPTRFTVLVKKSNDSGVVAIWVK